MAGSRSGAKGNPGAPAGDAARSRRSAEQPEDGLEIRPARRSDGDRVRALLAELDALHVQLRPDFFRVHPPSGATGTIGRVSPDLLRSTTDSSTALLLAIRGAETVGLVHVEVRDTPQQPGFTQRRRLLVDSIVVSRSVRRQGVGRRLMVAAEKWGRSRGAAQVVLTVWSGNEEAERFYQSLGFSTVSRSMARELG